MPIAWTPSATYHDAFFRLPQVPCHLSSEAGLSSVTSIVIGSKSAIIINPPFLIPDALSVDEQTKSLTSDLVVAVFVTHHHPQGIW